MVPRTKLKWSSDGTSVYLTQPNHINAALIRFNMTDCKVAPTPMITDFDSESITTEDHINPDFPYNGLIGRLLWIGRNTRPDILNAVAMLASFNSNFSDYHIQQAKRVLAYLKGTISFGLYYSKQADFSIEQPLKMHMYSDSDWVRCKSTRRSITGYVGYLLSCPIIFSSTYQTSTNCYFSNRSRMYGNVTCFKRNTLCSKYL